MNRSVHVVFAATWLLNACGGSHGHDHTLVRVDEEPAGPNCINGGTAIHTGIDHDQDNTLDDPEIASTEYICDTSSAVRCLEPSTSIAGPITLSASDDFSALTGVSCIDGDLMIVGTTLADIPSSPDLQTVTGSVIVAGNPALTSLGGLPNIREVGQKYVVQGNDSLIDLNGLGALRRFQGLAIVGNDSLPNLAALAPLTELDGGLQISNNDALTSLQGLENVTRGLRDRITIVSNNNLTSVDALANLQSAVLIEIDGNDALMSISLPNLNETDAYVLIKDNTALVELALPNLFTTGGLLVRSNPALNTVQAPELVLAGGVAVEHASSLSSINLPKLAYTTGDFALVNLPELTQASVSSLISIGGRFYANQLPKLARFAGFTKLRSVGGNFTIQACSAMTDFTGFTNLIDVANMTVTQNAQLVTFSGLDSFAKVGGDLVITDNPNLASSTAHAFAQAITILGTVTIE